MNPLIGADPELFVVHRRKPVSAHLMVPGTKSHPFPVPNGAIQVDGMALEFNINPVSTQREFVRNIKTVMGRLKQFLPEKHKFLIESYVEFDPDYLKNQPKEALELGCDPDFNAYTKVANNPPDAGRNSRTAAGHIHIGWTRGENISPDSSHFEDCLILVKHLDYYVGNLSLLFDKNDKRQEMYGKPGAFRPKSYGVEYRVPSNFWIKDEKLMKLVFKLVCKEFIRLKRGDVNPTCDYDDPDNKYPHEKIRRIFKKLGRKDTDILYPLLNPYSKKFYRNNHMWIFGR